MIRILGFGIIDNGILVSGAILGFSLEDMINKFLAWCMRRTRYSLHTRVKGLRASLLGAGIANAISDFLGGWCVGWKMAVGTFLGCMIIVIGILPLIFKLEKNNARLRNFINSDK